MKPVNAAITFFATRRPGRGGPDAQTKGARLGGQRPFPRRQGPEEVNGIPNPLNLNSAQRTGKQSQKSGKTTQWKWTRKQEGFCAPGSYDLQHWALPVFPGTITWLKVFVTGKGSHFNVTAQVYKAATLCCGIILLYALSVYSSHWLIKKLLWPIARLNKARLESQPEIQGERRPELKDM